MNPRNRKELNRFNRSLKAETNEAYQTYIAAQKAYKKILKNFITKNITGTRHFKEMYGWALDGACNCYSTEPGDWAVDELLTLDWMISDYQYYLEDLEDDQA